ncbi:NrfD/PsrC family molybdoenzyme membrane anchor subunit [Aggregatilinea lenta]|uniref:NrfD/PsrC family molybdoenzyme membrane anchor subunit n=1 Tax=Aggregatilinea lenta TaxID=913108 RepID=UPI000E5BE2E8|nr:NrfD/PsrC family molybdoenzyme membrane anchor subunit [Aggregatilinea lenta]
MTTMMTTLRRQVITYPRYAVWATFIGVLLLIGAISAINVLLNGLAVTNLLDQVPWGLWITIDLSAIALGAGAFSLSTIAYIFRVKSFERIARMAVFVGFVGYTSAMLALIMDIGRPERFWHPTVYWNVHSVLWEITMCVVFYSMVLVFELSPAILEMDQVRRRIKRAPQIAHVMHRFTPFVAIFGLGLSLLHQSSLGATYGVLVARPLWFKPSLPVMFILSAVAAGATITLAVTVFYENMVQSRKISSKLRGQIATFAGLVTLGYLYLKLWDFLATFYYSHLPARVEANEILHATTPYGTTFWWIEVVLGALIPAIILLSGRLRSQDMWVLVAGLLAVIGVIVNRWNVTLSGLVVPMDWSPGVADLFPVHHYFPSLTEMGVGLGVLGYALLMLTLGLRFLPLFPASHGHDAGH